MAGNPNFIQPKKVTPFKGGCSDAFKRAAVQFGIGRYLYYIPNQWYPLTEFKTFEEEPKLPKWALPNPDIADWEELAIQEYDQSKDVDLEQIQETEILDQSNSRKAEIIANLKNKTNQ